MAVLSLPRFAAPVVAALALAFVVAACSKTPPATGAATPGSPADFTQNVGDRILFVVDQSTITPTAAATLDKQAAWLNKYPKYQVTVEGHADERGTREYNIALSARRADAARNYLASRGVSTGRMRTIAYGKERPVALGHNEAAWSQNRRSVTIIGN